MVKEKLKFYDVKGKIKFNSNKYKLTTRRVKGTTRYFAISNAPSGIKAWRIISKLTYNNNK